MHRSPQGQTTKQGLANYVPGSFFLAPVDSDYRGYVLYARASYTW